ncbi:hypothetical protein V8C86DRAFT_1514959 [Haematococcus lacustris]
MEELHTAYKVELSVANAAAEELGTQARLMRLQLAEAEAALEAEKGKSHLVISQLQAQLAASTQAINKLEEERMETLELLTGMAEGSLRADCEASEIRRVQSELAQQRTELDGARTFFLEQQQQIEQARGALSKAATHRFSLDDVMTLAAQLKDMEAHALPRIEKLLRGRAMFHYGAHLQLSTSASAMHASEYLDKKPGCRAVSSGNQAQTLQSMAAVEESAPALLLTQELQSLCKSTQAMLQPVHSPVSRQGSDHQPPAEQQPGRRNAWPDSPNPSLSSLAAELQTSPSPVQVSRKLSAHVLVLLRLVQHLAEEAEADAARLMDREARISQAEASLAASQEQAKQVAQEASQVPDLQRQLQEAAQQSAELRSLVKVHRAKTKEQLLQAVQQNKILKQQLVEKHTAGNAAHSRAQELQAECHQLKESMLEARQAEAELEAQLAMLKEHCHTLQAKLDAKDAEVQQVRDQLRSAAEEAQQAAQRLAQAEDNIQATTQLLQQEQAARKADNATAHLQLEVAQNAARAQLQAVMDAYAHELQALHNQTASMEQLLAARGEVAGAGQLARLLPHNAGQHLAAAEHQLAQGSSHSPPVPGLRSSAQGLPQGASMGTAESQEVAPNKEQQLAAQEQQCSLLQHQLQMAHQVLEQQELFRADGQQDLQLQLSKLGHQASDALQQIAQLEQQVEQLSGLLLAVQQTAQQDLADEKEAHKADLQHALAHAAAAHGRELQVALQAAEDRFATEVQQVLVCVEELQAGKQHLNDQLLQAKGELEHERRRAELLQSQLSQALTAAQQCQAQLDAVSQQLRQEQSAHQLDLHSLQQLQTELGSRHQQMVDLQSSAREIQQRLRDADSRAAAAETARDAALTAHDAALTAADACARSVATVVAHIVQEHEQQQQQHNAPERPHQPGRPQRPGHATSLQAQQSRAIQEELAGLRRKHEGLKLKYIKQSLRQAELQQLLLSLHSGQPMGVAPFQGPSPSMAAGQSLQHQRDTRQQSNAAGRGAGSRAQNLEQRLPDPSTTFAPSQGTPVALALHNRTPGIATVSAAQTSANAAPAASSSAALQPAASGAAWPMAPAAAAEFSFSHQDQSCPPSAASTAAAAAAANAGAAAAAATVAATSAMRPLGDIAPGPQARPRPTITGLKHASGARAASRPVPPEVLQLAQQFTGQEGGQRPSSAAPSTRRPGGAGREAPVPQDVLRHAQQFLGSEGEGRPSTAVPSALRASASNTGLPVELPVPALVQHMVAQYDFQKLPEGAARPPSRPSSDRRLAYTPTACSSLGIGPGLGTLPGSAAACVLPRPTGTTVAAFAPAPRPAPGMLVVVTATGTAPQAAHAAAGGRQGQVVAAGYGLMQDGEERSLSGSSSLTGWSAEAAAAAAGQALARADSCLDESSGLGSHSSWSGVEANWGGQQQGSLEVRGGIWQQWERRRLLPVGPPPAQLLGHQQDAAQGVAHVALPFAAQAEPQVVEQGSREEEEEEQPEQWEDSEQREEEEEQQQLQLQLQEVQGVQLEDMEHGGAAAGHHAPGSPLGQQHPLHLAWSSSSSLSPVEQEGWGQGVQGQWEEQAPGQWVQSHPLLPLAQYHHPRPPHGASGWTRTSTRASASSAWGSACSTPLTCAAVRSFRRSLPLAKNTSRATSRSKTGCPR